MTADPTPLARGARDPLLAPKLAVAMLIALRLAFGVLVPPINDEAYYWLWGQHPALSYFDHPPLNAWAQGLVSIVFGWNLFSLRLLTWLTTGAIAAIFWQWTRRLAPEHRDAYFWYGAAIFLASPVMAAMTTIAFNDHLMLALSLGSAWCFTEFLARFTEGRRQPLWLYASGALLGLAVLTKYNAAFLGAGYLLTVLLRRELRPLLAYPHAWLACLLALGLQLPILLFALQTDFASFRFHLAERGAGDSGPTGPSLTRAVRYHLWQLFWFSPLLWLPLARYILTRPADSAAAQRRTLAWTTLAVAALVMGALSFSIQVLPYWTVVGYMLSLPFLVPFIRSRLVFWGHVATGVVFGLVMVVNLGVMPIANMFSQNDRGTSVLYGWHEVGAAMTAARQAHPEAFLAATHYNLAAPLGYELRTTDVTTLSRRRDQFDYWVDDATHTGGDALLLSDRSYGIASAEPRFEALQLLAEIPIVRNGHHLHTFLIYLGKSYRPEVTRQ